ncbi:hypothetical protein HDV05_000132 [Chytridiales sp. JEL 0842]|nr:hypothetical protein HDV05_000132 [Chytridiales sp. JEL 0842]
MPSLTSTFLLAIILASLSSLVLAQNSKITPTYPADCNTCQTWGQAVITTCAQTGTLTNQTSQAIATCLCQMYADPQAQSCMTCVSTNTNTANAPATALLNQVNEACQTSVASAARLIASVVGNGVDSGTGGSNGPSGGNSTTTRGATAVTTTTTTIPAPQAAKPTSAAGSVKVTTSALLAVVFGSMFLFA